MPFRNLLKLIMSHPQFGPQIINKLADSRPIRWAAKLTASLYLRGKHEIEQKIKDPKTFSSTQNPQHPASTNSQQKFSGNRFKTTFVEELKKEWEKTMRNKRK